MRLTVNGQRQTMVHVLRAVFLLIFVAAVGILILTVLFPQWATTPRSAQRQRQESIGSQVTVEAADFTEVQRIATGKTDPTALAVTMDDRILVAVPGRITIYDREGQTVGGFPLSEPVKCLATGPENCIFVGYRDRIEVLELSGAHRERWTLFGRNAYLTGIAVAATGILVADAGNRAVWLLDATGRLLIRIPESTRPEPDRRFIVPSPHFDVAWADDGTFWVANPGKRRLERYTTEGRRTAIWGQSSQRIDGFCGCCNPTDIAVDAKGRIITSEKGCPRVKLYSADGALLGVVAPDSLFAPRTTGLDVAVDSRDRILVLDPRARLVRIFVENPGVPMDGAADDAGERTTVH